MEYMDVLTPVVHSDHTCWYTMLSTTLLHLVLRLGGVYKTACHPGGYLPSHPYTPFGASWDSVGHPADMSSQGMINIQCGGDGDPEHPSS